MRLRESRRHQVHQNLLKEGLLLGFDVASRANDAQVGAGAGACASSAEVPKYFISVVLFQVALLLLGFVVEVPNAGFKIIKGTVNVLTRS